MHFIKSLLFVCLIFLFKKVDALCHLPYQWSGKWYQSKDTDLLSINRTHFVNRGNCIEHKQDKFMFYESKEECYRCVFIMQKHPNVLQYRASYCSDTNDFNFNCQNLSPESELITIYRDNSLSEKCPLNGLYVLTQSNQNQNSQQTLHDDRAYRSANSKCIESSNQESMIMECSDQSMLKLQFGKCTSMPTFIVNCIAHWTEGNTNYLIGRVTTNSNQKPSYKCLVYTETSSSQSNPQVNSRQNSDFIDLTAYNNENSLESKSTLQVSISQDEFCRNIDNILDEQFSFTFNKVHGSKYHVAPPAINQSVENRRIRRDLNTSKHSSHCKFPKWLNKKWHNFKQTKSFTLDYKLDSLLVLDEKNSIVINKYTCSHMKAKKNNYVQAIVKSLNGCSSGYQCLTISTKSDYVLEIKFGKISYGNSAIDCNDNHISQEFVYVDTNYGVKCPLKNGVYEKLNSKTSLFRSAALQMQETQTLNSKQPQEPCKYLTQTQTLQVGCQSDQQYSLRTKLCYPNHQYNSKLDSNPHEKSDFAFSSSSSSKLTTTAYTQLESEINLVCLAHWKHDGNYVIVSRTMSNEILCSIWSSSEDGKILQLLEIDSNCNYNKKSSHQRINYGFVYMNSCNEQSAAYSSSSSSSSSSSLSSLSSSFYFSTSSSSPSLRLNLFSFLFLFCIFLTSN